MVLGDRDVLSRIFPDEEMSGFVQAANIATIKAVQWMIKSSYHVRDMNTPTPYNPGISE